MTETEQQRQSAPGRPRPPVRVVEVGPRDGLQNEPHIRQLTVEELVDVRVKLVTALATYVDMYRAIHHDDAEGFDDRLAEVNPRIYASNVAITQALASGEIWVARVM